ncbi:RNA polymerase sigma factor [Cellulomonas fimi]|uniref:RNA polymerase, sigma-24 subunit, ECF subfamily n=1 Tax=Cellulomonas fimi (strain ATCC 484 / DSM 20113 / JCM 1341 / CCUG 24087 / LMG 16345 / NBRC 15513 / NCIMB 8980 / NCTC 7547 / NRS-133) TaxID=590998 RepID=F4GYV2_CELFA|nr:RNA polymerase sigma factor [Cellulomonas fimi]AEE44821.1 RNA polymerase, sigma-24 subunit, ECF subfamily [Cellulomonas fimi ATCC 484]VEH27389.1 RNA polymerase sigma factor sigM [Cellulomonas fimi]
MSTSPPTDAQRFAALWEQHAPRVQAWTLRHVDRDTAQEVVAETFLVAWRRLADVPGDALPWLLVVARNTLRNHRRSAYRARQLHGVLAALAPPPPDDPAAAVAERQALLRALADLSTSDREAVLLVAWDGLTAAQAAEVLGCSPAAFKMRLSRARRRLTRAADGTPDTTALRLVPGSTP